MPTIVAHTNRISQLEWKVSLLHDMVKQLHRFTFQQYRSSWQWEVDNSLMCFSAPLVGLVLQYVGQAMQHKGQLPPPGHWVQCAGCNVLFPAKQLSNGEFERKRVCSRCSAEP